ncbi:hypothetical protein ER308_15085 [Egibacter rhizosphaerae]|uniref:AbiEi antitoxin C-terminal domain-containing protein n=1 Tax=Egibacter rhizosphaerae TaxID=1670831 RepID=A0A411YHD8_9ACTN|nr:type IV toxin-antitoxin system AbiEi family antitoxin [Egibacter rhizosphaerae]QBI20755.1 hypothetical protein ER308_15085 [Egibacter rhizosphaerae]
MGIAVADHGERAALMGLSAARYHGAVPRAHATAWVAVGVNRRPIDGGVYGRVVFVPRDLERLDLVRARTAIADGYVTGIEQTIVDLARRPAHGGGEDTAREAIARLWPRAETDRLDQLAREQRARAALNRVRVEQGAAG